MNGYDFHFCGADLTALPSGALWWAEHALLCVSDLHLGKSERFARRNGVSLPPYETQDTLARLEADLDATQARQVVCLGDSFDDLGAAHALPDDARMWIARLQAGRRWVWIEGNHDPGPVDLGGSHLAELRLKGVVFRHIAQANGRGEVSGHYHPKAQIRARARWITRPAFLVDQRRVLLPAYGTYTGGLHCHCDPLTQLMAPDAIAVLTGQQAVAVPMPRYSTRPLT